MIGVLVTSHHTLAESILGTCDMVIGNHNDCYSVCLDSDILSFKEKMSEVLGIMQEKYEEIIILSDLKGGTPYNQSLNYKLGSGEKKVHLISGFNFPMLVELVVTLPQANDATELLEKIKETGVQGIEIYQDDEVEEMDIF